MANITTCTVCGEAFEATSEEMANEQERFCSTCHELDDSDRKLIIQIRNAFNLLLAARDRILELQKRNSDIEARLKVIEDRLGVNINNPCSTG